MMRRFVLLIEVLLLLHHCKGVRIGFGELDYVSNEGDGRARVVLTQSEQLTENITIPLMAISFGDFYGAGRTLTEHFDDIDLPDPAEYSRNPEERSDFIISEPISVTFGPNEFFTVQQQEIFIPLVIDDINEDVEGFFMIILAENISASGTVIELVRGGVTLVNILDDDLISIGFEQREYFFEEEDSFISETVLVTKGDVVSEQTLTLLVQFSSNNFATEGEDFDIDSLITLTFRPNETELPVPFHIRGDTVPEDLENFRLFLSIGDVKAGLQIGRNFSTLINIIDNDELSIGFERNTYTVNEGDGSSIVCVDIKDLDAGSLQVYAEVISAVDTATENDFGMIRNNFLALPLFDGTTNQCFEIPINDDTIIEGDEVFRVTLQRISDLTPPNAVFVTPEAIITIVDNDRLPPECTTSSQCHPQAGCIIRESEPKCVCRNGFEGNGKTTCKDIDECQLNTDNCDSNANCVNTRGSFQCNCKPGFTGNGFQCSDMNECQLNTDNCDSNANCVNTRGSFQCNCKPGFTGNGFQCSALPTLPPIQEEPLVPSTAPPRSPPTRATPSRATPLRIPNRWSQVRILGNIGGNPRRPPAPSRVQTSTAPAAVQPEAEPEVNPCQLSETDIDDKTTGTRRSRGSSTRATTRRRRTRRRTRTRTSRTRTGTSRHSETRGMCGSSADTATINTRRQTPRNSVTPRRVNAVANSSTFLNNYRFMRMRNYRRG